MITGRRRDAGSARVVAGLPDFRTSRNNRPGWILDPDAVAAVVVAIPPILIVPSMSVVASVVAAIVAPVMASIVAARAVGRMVRPPIRVPVVPSPPSVVMVVVSDGPGPPPGIAAKVIGRPEPCKRPSIGDDHVAKSCLVSAVPDGSQLVMRDVIQGGDQVGQRAHKDVDSLIGLAGYLPDYRTAGRADSPDCKNEHAADFSQIRADRLGRVDCPGNGNDARHVVFLAIPAFDRGIEPFIDSVLIQNPDTRGAPDFPPQPG